MKQLFLFLAILFISLSSFGQIGGLNQSSSAASAGSNFDCRIWYTYDAVGNRIKRHYSCLEPEGPAEPGTFDPNVYPNPTTGPFTVDFDELVHQATLSVYDMDGSLLGSTEAEMAYAMEYDITGSVPGTYLVVLHAVRENGEEVNAEFQLIKLD